MAMLEDVDKICIDGKVVHRQFFLEKNVSLRKVVPKSILQGV
jgi:hypothetical protein